MFRVEVKYRYRVGNCWTQTNGAYCVQGKSESAIIAHLRRQHSADEVVLIDYRWS